MSIYKIGDILETSYRYMSYQGSTDTRTHLILDIDIGRDDDPPIYTVWDIGKARKYTTSLASHTYNIKVIYSHGG